MKRHRPRHAWKGALHRNLYVLLFTPDREWMRVFYFGHGEWLVVDLNNNPVSPEPLVERLVRAVINELRDGDPYVTIGVGDNEVRAGW